MLQIANLRLERENSCVCRGPMPKSLPLLLLVSILSLKGSHLLPSLLKCAPLAQLDPSSLWLRPTANQVNSPR